MNGASSTGRAHVECIGRRPGKRGRSEAVLVGLDTRSAKVIVFVMVVVIVS